MFDLSNSPTHFSRLKKALSFSENLLATPFPIDFLLLTDTANCDFESMVEYYFSHYLLIVSCGFP